MARKRIAKLLDRYRVTSGKGFKLKNYDPANTAPDLIKHQDADAMLERSVTEIGDLQAKLFAQNRWALLCVLQAMDTAGKDGTVKHVMTGVNPQGVEVSSFKGPSATELEHDFLWRISAALPRRGTIGIFNRSYYEEVLVARVHPEILQNQRLPPERTGHKIWQHRLEDINNFESYLCRQGIVTVKFFLHLSKDEQRRRLLARLDDPDKHWKFDINDLKERAFWDEYQTCFEQAIAATATKQAPWYVVPADNKWFAHLVVGEAIIHALKQLDLDLPPPSAERVKTLDAARKQLED